MNLVHCVAMALATSGEVRDRMTDRNLRPRLSS
jgi:hypothetical protein